MTEPKAWMYICDGDEKHPVITHTKQDWPNHEGGWWQEFPLYQKREWIGLTDEDKESFWTADQMTQEEWDELFNAIEAKLKEKNNG
jgi:hypothetical protein